MALTLTVNQQATGQVKPVDRKGNPAQVQDGTVDFQSSDKNVCTIEEDPNDETKFVVIAHNPGVAQVTVTADADLGDGVETIETFAAVEVQLEKAVGFGIEFGEPVDKPDTNESPAD